MKDSKTKLQSVPSKSKPSKGERKGWTDREKYKTVPVNSIAWESKKLEVYPVNRYGLPKLVP